MLSIIASSKNGLTKLQISFTKLKPEKTYGRITSFGQRIGSETW